VRTALVFLSFLTLAGCTALVVGGGTGGSYSQGKDERPQSVVNSDSAISGSIRQKLVADPVVSNFRIGVRTYKGTVTLSGTVGSYVARDRALDLAKSTTGVITVTNQIVVEDRN
jgi:osmotically-inducible protein OsmY